MSIGPNYTENLMHSREKRCSVYTNADYAAGGIDLGADEHTVHVYTGAAGVLAFRLPLLSQVPQGSIYSIFLVDFTTSNATVDDRNDGLVALGQSVLTADNDRVVFMSCGTHWLLLEDVTT